MKKTRPSTSSRPHDTPTFGPRARPRKVQAVPRDTRRGHRYEPGAPPPRPRNPWVDEGEPEPNG
jgi:hypothetical protein